MRHQGIAAVGLIAALVMVLGGCGFFKSALDTKDRTGLFQLEPSSPTGIDRYGTLDEAYARMAKAFPGFGGIFFDDFGVLNLYLQDPNKFQEAVATLEPLLLDYFGREAEIIPPASTWKVRQGQYDYVQLYQMHEKLWPLLRYPGVIMTDINERENRITIGLEKETLVMELLGTGPVAQAVIALGVPLQAVVFIERNIPQFTSTLRSRRRPVIGGIQGQVKGAGICTLMLPVRHGTHGLGFITNAHCTGSGLEGIVPNPPPTLHQPEYIPTDPTRDVIGTERLDPYPFPGPVEGETKGTTCYQGERCRWSDSAFFKVSSGVTLEVGVIAKPDQSLNIVGQWGVVGIVRHPPSGLAISKVGRTTGWTQGTVEDTCFRGHVGWWGSTTANVVLLCSYMSYYSSAGGDSGAPVFHIRPSNPSTVNIVGIHWGKDRIINWISYFSPMGGIMRDLSMAGGFCISNLC